MSIIFDYPSIKQERDKDDTVVLALEKEHKAHLVYCNCRGQDMLSSSCGCFGTPKFYGPDDVDAASGPRSLRSTRRRG
jgi:hypothetical protein